MSEASTDDTASAASTNDTASAASTNDTASAANPDDTQPGSQGKSRTSEEDAAVVIAILTALTAGAVPSSGRSGPASVWADPAHMLRTRLSPGMGSWWASGLPR
ncbi:MAG TPA: acyl-CoA carboxylase subunit epsilon [Nakamurella sp.]|nr:acyl-CoA carboxylase subunit epsilon [Nakamurella sp.]